MKKYLWLFGLFLIGGLIGAYPWTVAWAMEKKSAQHETGAAEALAAKKTDAEILDTHNKICRVTGFPVSGEDFAVYKGKRYNLCCPMCKRQLREILDREARRR